MTRPVRKPPARKGKTAGRRTVDYDTFLAIRCSFEDRVILMDEYPAAFYFTDHYANYPAVLIRLSKVRRDVLRAVVEKAWRRTAPKRLVAERDRAHPG